MLNRVWAPSSASVLASWWGFAEADQTLLGLVVAVLVALALAYTGTRLGRLTRSSRRVRARRRSSEVRAPRRR